MGILFRMRNFKGFNKSSLLANSQQTVFNNKLPILGIISGAGPEAGAQLYLRVIKEFQNNGAWQDRDFPFIHVVNYPFAEMLQEPIDQELLIKQVEKAIDGLLYQGCDVIVMACNTLHLYLPKVLPEQFVSIFDVVKDKIKDIEEKLLVFASSSSVQSNLHGRLLNKSVDYFDPVKSQKIINSIMSGEQVDLSFIENLAYKQKVVLGCTEYSAKLINSKAPFIDPFRLFAEEYFSLCRESFIEQFLKNRRQQLTSKI